MRRDNGVIRSRSFAILVALVAVTGLSLTSINEVTWEQRALVFVMFALSGCSYANWCHDSKRTLPVYAAISGMYSVFFALALFWETPVSPSYLNREALLPEEALTASLRMVVLGLVALWMGMHLGLARQFINVRRLPDVPTSQLQSLWIRYLVVFAPLPAFCRIWQVSSALCKMQP